MEPQWAVLDHLVLNTIFEYLPFSDRFSASLVSKTSDNLGFIANHTTISSILYIHYQVCQNWYESFNSSKVWHRLIVTDKRFCNDFGTLDYDRCKAYMTQVGHHVQMISIKTEHQFNALYQFLVLLQWFNDQRLYACGRKRPLTRLRRFEFDFPCNTPLNSSSEGVKLFGIGGLYSS